MRAMCRSEFLTDVSHMCPNSTNAHGELVRNLCVSLALRNFASRSRDDNDIPFMLVFNSSMGMGRISAVCMWGISMRTVAVIRGLDTLSIPPNA